MKQIKKYHGVVVPMVTPVTEYGDIDERSVSRLIKSFISAGVSPLLLGTTGEGNSVSRAATVDLVTAACDTASKKTPVYACLTGTSLADQLIQADDFAAAGADVLTATLPGYYSLTDEQIYHYYSTLADHAKVPFMLYNIKATTHMSIPVEVVKRLASHPNIVGIKDSERNDDRMFELIDFAVGLPDFSYFCGCAANSATALLHGADGIVPSGGNFIPRMYANLYEAGVSGDVDKANSLQKQTNEMGQIYQSGFTLGESLAALKVICHELGLIDDIGMWGPLTKLSPEIESKVRGLVRGLDTTI